MKIFISILFATTISLNHCKQPINDNDARLKWMDSFKDPNLKYVPDSLKNLILILDTVLRADQKYRSDQDRTIYKRNQKKQHAIDIVNLKKVTHIIDKYGWLGPKDVGIIGSKAISMVMIHSNIEMKIKYYPKLIEAFKQQKIFPENVAMYEDKMNVMLLRRQYYGTQTSIFKGNSIIYPVVEVEKIDSIRKSIGLFSIKYYIGLFPKPDTSLAIYKKNLSEIIHTFKISNATPIHTDLGKIMDSIRQSKIAFNDSLKIKAQMQQ